MSKIPIRVVSDVEAEKGAYVVCIQAADDPGCFADNLTGICCACGEAVVFRPYMPKQPPKICLQCVGGALSPN